MSITITPETEELVTQAKSLLDNARQYKITNPAQLEASAEELKRIKARAKDLDAQRREMTKPLDDSKKRIMDFFREPLQFLTDAESLIKRAILAYQSEQEKLRRAQEAKLAEQARKERERLEKRAEAAAAKGQEEKAEMLRDQAVEVKAPVLAAPKAPAGIQTRELWSAEVFDAELVVASVLDGALPWEAITINQAYLDAQARLHKAALNIPGVRAVSSKTLAAGRA